MCRVLVEGRPEAAQVRGRQPDRQQLQPVAYVLHLYYSLVTCIGCNIYIYIYAYALYIYIYYIYIYMHRHVTTILYNYIIQLCHIAMLYV